MEKPNFERARQYALQRLENELSPTLVYHSVAHTRDDVVPAAQRLAVKEGISDDDRLLLLTAAHFHDLGFIEQRENHEQVSIRLVIEFLPEFGYSLEQVRVISNIIRATMLPQSPRTLLEKLMADADLDVLGREDFLASGNTLRCELSAFEPPFTDEQWYQNQLDFISSHHYFTSSAKALRNPGKEHNIKILSQILAGYSLPDR